MIEYIKHTSCVKCGSADFTETAFSEIHGHYYQCKSCGYKGWGGRKKNETQILKRPPCPTPRDLAIDRCQNFLRPVALLYFSEVLETHHIDDNPQNNDRLNLFVLCTKCHKLTHHDRLYLYYHAVEAENGG